MIPNYAKTLMGRGGIDSNNCANASFVIVVCDILNGLIDLARSEPSPSSGINGFWVPNIALPPGMMVVGSGKNDTSDIGRSVVEAIRSRLFTGMQQSCAPLCVIQYSSLRLRDPKPALVESMQKFLDRRNKYFLLIIET